ncbi:unnamed protein product [Menidia menidia]|uniref:E3 ubiquitin-protein ligase n=1 Tax=Menidia menidia TaxID=238744 RepID=A0A8S4BCQ2_9TELE|nr:unnamed protein product [Menidia menidia]
MSAAALPVCLTRPPKLVLHPPPVSKGDIKPVPGFGHCCRKTTRKQARKGLYHLHGASGGAVGVPGPGAGPGLQTRAGGPPGPVRTPVPPPVPGGHVQQREQRRECPTCKTIYGVKTGSQPAGKMEYHVIPHSLPGHPDCKSIRIIYNITPGIQGPEHPNPGKPFTARGFPRHCYLPDSDKGRKHERIKSRNNYKPSIWILAPITL